MKYGGPVLTLQSPCHTICPRTGVRLALEILLAPFKVFQLLPITAVVPAALLLLSLAKSGGGRHPPKRLVITTSIMWISYAIWEYRVSLWAATEVAPIRVDLLLIYPLLALMTILSVAALWRHGRSSAPGGD